MALTWNDVVVGARAGALDKGVMTRPRAGKNEGVCQGSPPYFCEKESMACFSVGVPCTASNSMARSRVIRSRPIRATRSFCRK